MNKKHIYETPQTNAIVVRFEANIMSGPGQDNAPGKGWGSGNNDEEIINGGSF